LETELLEEDFLVGLGLGVEAEDQGASIGGWEVNSEHLDGGELVEDAADGFNARSMAATFPEQSMPAYAESRCGNRCGSVCALASAVDLIYKKAATK
jgi:hypothetical protein